MNFGHVDYLSTTPPSSYRCMKCGVFGCKLWREYQTFANHTRLMCCDCAGKDQKKDVGQIDAEGSVPLESIGSLRSDVIGWLVPAVPTEEGDTFWGYTAVPSDGVEWWKKLPTRVAAA